MLNAPRVLVKTKEVERTIVRVVDHATSMSLTQPDGWWRDRHTSLSEWVWGVKRHRQYIKVDDYLTHGSEWRKLIQKTLQAFQQTEDA